MTTIAGGHEVGIAVYASRATLEATGDFTPEEIDQAEAEGEFYGEDGQSITFTEVAE